MELNHKLHAVWQLFQKGDVAQAAQLALQIVQSNPNAVEAQHLLGICYAQQGNDVAAEVAFKVALGLAPNHPQLLANQATLLRRQNRLEDAAQLWQRAVSVAPKFTQAWIDLGLAELKLGRHLQAVAPLQQATIQQPQSALAWHGLGNAQRLCGELEAAELAFKNAIQFDPKYESAWVNLGAIQRLLGRADESLLSYESARKCGNDGPLLANATVGSLIDTGQIDQAFKQARQLVAAYPDYVPGHVSLANLQWEYSPNIATGDDPLEQFKASALMQPLNRDLQISYISFLIKADQAAAALEHIEKYVDHKDQPEVMMLRADAYEIIGEQEHASKLFSKLYNIAGMKNTAFLNAYIRHLLKAGLYDHAALYTNEAIQLDPLNQEAWAYMSTIWRLQGDAREYWLSDYERFITLQEIEVPSGYADLQSFLLALRTTLEPMHLAKHAPVQQSLRGGSQTPGQLFGRKNHVIEEVQRAFRHTIQHWIKTLPEDSRHPFLNRNTQAIRFCDSWSVKLWSSGKHVNHIHPEGWISSAFYVALPATVISTANNNTAGYIQFGQPLAELNLDLEPRRIIKPELGKLALFPSYMWHGTVPFIDEQPRISVAFDMQPKA